MEKKMTSGEIANKAGISQKALRLYDEKGLLKPTAYSEKNYRLYDEDSLIILEKIIALKHVGFSLEEIKDNLENSDNNSIPGILQNQVEMMEQKIWALQKIVKCIQAVLARTDGKPDWDDVADIIKKMEADQGADERHMYAVSHAADGLDWYEKIYDSLGFRENDRVLDLGCGYAKLWRNNWARIPQNLIVDGYDLHESWAEDFEKYIEENRESLPHGTDIRVYWKDVEAEDTWDDIKPCYSKVIAHYLMSVIEDMEKLVERAASVLMPGGMFSMNYYGTTAEYEYWEEIFAKLGMDISFAEEKRQMRELQQEDLETLLSMHFTKLEFIKIPGPLTYDDPERLFERVLQRYPDGAKYLNAQKAKLIKYFEKRMAEEGVIVVQSDSGFWHCYK
ncbi:MAG: MerR family transcriptional regulator [Lachnospiraceae bacterium]|nr:MerR family transcriptional regulator [Lachnospiraceae bacterium]